MLREDFSVPGQYWPVKAACLSTKNWRPMIQILLCLLIGYLIARWFYA